MNYMKVYILNIDLLHTHTHTHTYTHTHTHIYIYIYIYIYINSPLLCHHYFKFNLRNLLNEEIYTLYM